MMKKRRNLLIYVDSQIPETLQHVWKMIGKERRATMVEDAQQVSDQPDVVLGMVVHRLESVGK